MLARLGVFALLALPFGDVASALCQRDCAWHMEIAETGYFLNPKTGYLPGQANWAFFPLYPLLVRTVAALGLATVKAGLVVSTLSCVGFAVAFTRYVQTTRPGSRLGPWLLLLAVWPLGFYDQINYSEGLYACLAIIAMLASQRGQLMPAAVATALLSATRLTGVLLSLWVAGRAVLEAMRELSSNSAPRLSFAAKYLLPIAVAPLGLFAFAAYLGWRTGDPLAFSHVQVAWGRDVGNPIVRLWHGLLKWDLHYLASWRTRQSETLDAILALSGLAAAFFLAMRRRFLEAYFCGASVLLPLCAGGHSMPRYIGANPAFLLAVGDLLTMMESRRLRAAILVVMALMQVGLVWMWMEGSIGIE